MERSFSLALRRAALVLLALSTVSANVLAQSKPRARDLGIPFVGSPGPNNAITDVAGVLVGHTTLISGQGELRVGEGPVRTGVTVILPRGDALADPVFSGWFALNGNGEMTGTTWIEESGFLEGPIAITNTHSVGVVRDAVIAWQRENGTAFQPWSLPVVAETYDGSLNDINGFHVRPEHLVSAIEEAASGPVAEGNVGGGTGMRCLGFKCGIGTASRAGLGAGDYTVGVLVQANFGGGRGLTIAGVPVGMEFARARGDGARPGDDAGSGADAGSGTDAVSDGELEIDLRRDGRGSIIIVVATDAPLLPHQLKRIARRAALGVARTGGISGNGSGDIFVAFSTANAATASAQPTTEITVLSNSRISALFEATVQATEEAIINAMIAAETMVGRDDNRSEAIPHERLREILRAYNRLNE